MVGMMRLQAEAAAVTSVVSPEFPVSPEFHVRLALIGEFVNCHGNSNSGNSGEPVLLSCLQQNHAGITQPLQPDSAPHIFLSA